MINRLIDFSINNRLIIGLLIVGLVIWGVFSVVRLPIDAVPDITNNQVQVITVAPTLAAQEVEQFITRPVEVATAIIPGVIEQRSVSRLGLSLVTIVFEDKIDSYLARQLVNEKLTEAEAEIPKGVGNPGLAPISTGLGEIYQYLLKTKPGYDSVYSLSELRTIQDWIVKRQLLGTPGIAEVSSLGGYIKQYEVSVDPNRLRSMNITISQLFGALEKNNQNMGAAYIEKGSEAYFVRGIGMIQTPEDIEKIVVANPNGRPLLVRDIAVVQEGHAIRYGAVTHNGKGEVVGGMVLMLKGENSAEVIARVKEKMVEIQKTLPEGVYIEPFLDRTKLVNSAIHTVAENLMLGALIVIFILVLMLGHIRAGLLVASVIPLSMLFAIALMKTFGIAGNLMSLGAIDFGLIVDGAVIIVERVVHQLTQDVRRSPSRMLHPQAIGETIRNSSKKMMNSAFFGQIIIFIVYLPILTLEGVEGKMFKPMALTVIFAVIGATILCLTFVPAFAGLFIGKSISVKTNFADRIMEHLKIRYISSLAYFLKRKTIVLATAILLFAGSLVMFSSLGGEFIPTLEEGDFLLFAKIKSGSSLAQNIETSNKIGLILKSKFPEVKDFVGKMGVGEIPTDPTPIEASDNVITLKDKSEWTSAKTREELVEKMKEALSVLPGVTFEFSQPIQMRYNELMTGVKSDIAVKIYGEDMDVLAEKSAEAAKLISRINGVGDMKVEQTAGLPQINVTYNRDKISLYGLQIEDINNILKAAFAGAEAGFVFEGEKRFDLVVRLDKNYRTDIQDVMNIYIPLPSGKQIPLEQVADIQMTEGPQQVSRDNARRRITISVNARDRDVQSLIDEIKVTLDTKLKLPAGYTLSYGGLYQNLVHARKRLMIAVPIALFLIWIMLWLSFRRFKETLIIFSAVPFSAIGGVLALYLRDMPFSISAGVGFIALFGVAVLNGIVMVAQFNHLEENGVSDVWQRIREGAGSRLRPVLMTAMVASFGFLPMALSSSAGAEVQRPLATVVIGGLISSSLLTLYVLPVLYLLISGKRKKTKNLATVSVPATLILLVLLFCNPVKAQQTPATLSLKQAIDTALKYNLAYRTSHLETEFARVSQKSACDLPKTSFAYSYGQLNGLAKDDEISVGQQIEFPLSYYFKYKLNEAIYRSAVFKEEMARQLLISEVKTRYIQLQFLRQNLDISYQSDSVFQRYALIAEARYRLGDASYLEQLSAQNALGESKNEIQKIENEWLAALKGFQNCLLSNVPVAPENSRSALLSMPVSGSYRVDANPGLQFQKQQAEIANRQTKVEKAKLLPDVSLNYYNQSFVGNQLENGIDKSFGRGDRFTGFTAGISVPLFWGAQKANIQAAKVRQQVSESAYEQARLETETMLFREQQNYNSLFYQSEYYKTTAVPQSETVLAFAQKAYSSGEIGYLEYLKAVEDVFKTKSKYIEKLFQLNQSIINIEFITGGINYEK